MISTGVLLGMGNDNKCFKLRFQPRILIYFNHNKTFVASMLKLLM